MKTAWKYSKKPRNDQAVCRCAELPIGNSWNGSQ
jgi:hypothetical protein